MGQPINSIINLFLLYTHTQHTYCSPAVCSTVILLSDFVLGSISPQILDFISLLTSQFYSDFTSVLNLLR